MFYEICNSGNLYVEYQKTIIFSPVEICFKYMFIVHCKYIYLYWIENISEAPGLKENRKRKCALWASKVKILVHKLKEKRVRHFTLCLTRITT